MPTCSVCGKMLKNPNSNSHINSKYHQERLRKPGIKEQPLIKPKIDKTFKISAEINQLKTIISNLEKRIFNIERVLNLKHQKESKKVFNLDEINIEREIINIINQKSNLQQIKGNFTLKDLRDLLIKDYHVPEYKFEEIILRLYRKQVIDLQPGGNPEEYHLLSPTGKKFYYLIAKN